MKKIPNSKMGCILALLVVLLLLGLPIAAWLDLSNLVEANLRRQASDVNSIISSMRNYYANNVVGRVLASPGTTQVVHNYKDVPGAIPIPATLSLELGRVISEQQQNISSMSSDCSAAAAIAVKPENRQQLLVEPDPV